MDDYLIISVLICGFIFGFSDFVPEGDKYNSVGSGCNPTKASIESCHLCKGRTATFLPQVSTTCGSGWFKIKHPITKSSLKNVMAEITRLYGIIIKIFFGEHRPHIHALYGEYNGLFDFERPEMYEGDLPNRAREMVFEWIENYQNELPEIWNYKQFRKLSPLD